MAHWATCFSKNATSALEWDNNIQNLQSKVYSGINVRKSRFTALLTRHHKTKFLTLYPTDNCDQNFCLRRYITSNENFDYS